MQLLFCLFESVSALNVLLRHFKRNKRIVNRVAFVTGEVYFHLEQLKEMMAWLKRLLLYQYVLWLEGRRIRSTVVVWRGRLVRLAIFKVELFFVIIVDETARWSCHETDLATCPASIVATIIDKFAIRVDKQQVHALALALDKLFVLGALRQLVDRVAAHGADELGSLRNWVIR